MKFTNYGLTGYAKDEIKDFNKSENPYVIWYMYDFPIPLYLYSNGEELYYEYVEGFIVQQDMLEVFICLTPTMNIHFTVDTKFIWDLNTLNKDFPTNILNLN